jgi:hypothetical protein
MLHNTRSTPKALRPGERLNSMSTSQSDALSLPNEDQFVTDVLNETKAGLVATSPEEVARVVKRWLDERGRAGGAAYRGHDAAVNRYSIRERARALAALLDAAINGHAAAPQAVQCEPLSVARTTTM